MKISSLLGAGVLALGGLTQCSESYTDDRLGVVSLTLNYEDGTKKTVVELVKLLKSSTYKGETIVIDASDHPYIQVEYPSIEIPYEEREQAFNGENTTKEKYWVGKVEAIVTKKNFLPPKDTSKNKRDDIKENTPFFGH